MAKTAKDILNESNINKSEKEITENVKVLMKKTYIGSKGCFYRANVYEVDSKFAKMLITNGDAEKC